MKRTRNDLAVNLRFELKGGNDPLTTYIHTYIHTYIYLISRFEISNCSADVDLLLLSLDKRIKIYNTSDVYEQLKTNGKAMKITLLRLPTINKEI